MIRRISLAFAVCLLLPALDAAAQRAVILVRHAERVDSATDSLSKAGHERAARLAAQLKDSGISAIYTTQFLRTIQTADPLAKAIGVQATVIPSTEQDKLVERIRTQHAKDVVLVVGHSNSIPAILKALGAAETITITENQYGDLYILVPNNPAPTVVRLHLID